MKAAAMDPHGAALQAFADGDGTAELIIWRSDGLEFRLPVSHFFREPASFTPIEQIAMDRCSGHVLDVGAGTGLHSLFLQSRGLRVTSLDINAQAVGIMTRQGLADVHCSDVFSFDGGSFDTILMLGHGLGMVETIAGMDLLLARFHRLLAPGGQVLLDSLDVRRTVDLKHLAYQESNRQAGRYVGETVLQFEFNGVRGPSCGWLHADPDTLRDHAAGAGWLVEILIEDEAGNYLARLAPGQAP